MRKDKKNVTEKINIILLKKIGVAIINNQYNVFKIKKFIISSHSLVKFFESHGTCLLFIVLPFVYAAIANLKFFESSSALPNANNK